MLENVDLKSVMVFDIETACSHKTYDKMNETMQSLWRDTVHDKVKTSEDETPAESYFNNAGLYPEFSKVVCISAGFFEQTSDDTYNLRIKSFYSHDEKEILTAFSELLQTRSLYKHYIVAHNGKRFDIPFTVKRMIVNGLPIPPFIQTYDVKPWDLKHILDTKEMWGFGGDAKTSLKTLCGVFDIPTPKDDIEGKDVTRVYWSEKKGLERIETYCKKDVLATARVFCKIIQRNVTINPLEL